MIAGTISTNNLLWLMGWQLSDLEGKTLAEVQAMVAKIPRSDRARLSDEEVAVRLHNAAHCQHWLVGYGGVWGDGMCLNCGWVEK